jgi:hypothetical protein
MKNLLLLFFLFIIVGIFSPILGQWQPHIIVPNIDRPAIFDFGDLDGDGDLDLGATSWGDGEILWYRNEGPPYTNWTGFLIDNGMPSIVGLVIIDLDVDNDSDIVVAAGGSTDAVKWYENDGGIWAEHFIDSDFNGGETVDAGDLDGDGDMDVVATGWNSNLIKWYENDSNTLNWTPHILDSTLDNPLTCRIFDINNDENLDIVACGKTIGEVVWYENDGGTTINFARHTIDINGPDGTLSVNVGDLDGDNDLDVAVTGYTQNNVYWCENNLPDTIWTKHPIDDNLELAWEVDITDVDLDSDLDLMVSARDENAVVWYENDLPDTTWTRNYIDSSLTQANFIVAYDIDGDSVPDAAAGSWSETSGIINWYENPVIINVQDDVNAVPVEYLLSQNYPNPFNPATTIHFQIPELSFVTLKVYDVLGSKVGTIVNEEKPIGSYEVEFDADNLPSGVYFYRLQAGDFQQVKKMVLIK